MYLVGCEDYNVLTNPKHKITYYTSDGKDQCDRVTSPDWQGPVWYRISPRIGTKIPTSPIKEWHYGTWMSGWLTSDSIPGLGETIAAKVWFVLAAWNDYYDVDVQIRNCSDYMLYYLPDTPDCTLGYCVE